MCMSQVNIYNSFVFMRNIVGTAVLLYLIYLHMHHQHISVLKNEVSDKRNEDQIECRFPYMFCLERLCPIKSFFLPRLLYLALFQKCIFVSSINPISLYNYIVPDISLYYKSLLSGLFFVICASL